MLDAGLKMGFGRVAEVRTWDSSWMRESRELDVWPRLGSGRGYRMGHETQVGHGTQRWDLGRGIKVGSGKCDSDGIQDLDFRSCSLPCSTPYHPARSPKAV